MIEDPARPLVEPFPIITDMPSCWVVPYVPEKDAQVEFEPEPPTPYQPDTRKGVAHDFTPARLSLWAPTTGFGWRADIPRIPASALKAALNEAIDAWLAEAEFYAELPMAQRRRRLPRGIVRDLREKVTDQMAVAWPLTPTQGYGIWVPGGALADDVLFAWKMHSTWRPSMMGMNGLVCVSAAGLAKFLLEHDGYEICYGSIIDVTTPLGERIKTDRSPERLLDPKSDIHQVQVQAVSDEDATFTIRVSGPDKIMSLKFTAGADPTVCAQVFSDFYREFKQ